MVKKTSLKTRALRLLAVREHSQKELTEKLAKHSQDREEIETLLTWLKAEDFLSEARFTESMIRRKAAQYGGARILRELEKKGIKGNLLEDAKVALKEDELQRAFNVWQKKFGAVPISAQESIKQKWFMQQRGFSQEIIQQVWRHHKDMANLT